jgi:methionyl-tRNA formyltransferase
MRIVFIGTGDIGIPSLQALMDSPDHSVVGVVTQPDRPAGRHQVLAPPPIKQLAASRFIPVFQPDRIRSEAAIEQIRFLRPDVIVVMAYGQILPRDVLIIPPLACLNLHASLLPRHRGAAPIQAAIQAGDRETGITVMHMSEGLDCGDILLKEAIRINRRETGGSLHDRLAQLAPSALLEALRQLKAGTAPRIPQNDEEATYAPKLTRESGRIDWTFSREMVDARIRAMNPWPGAFTTVPEPDGSEKKLKIFSSIRSRQTGKPGVVIRHDKHGILVGCGQGGVLLREVQLEGKRRLAPAEFFQGTKIEPGTPLGNVDRILLRGQ